MNGKAAPTASTGIDSAFAKFVRESPPCRGQPSPTSVIPAPELTMRSAISAFSSVVSRAKLRWFVAGNLNCGESFLERFPQRRQHLKC